MTQLNIAPPARDFSPEELNSMRHDAIQSAAIRGETVGMPRTMLVTVVSSILEIVPGANSAAEALASIQRRRPSAVLRLIGPELEPTGIICNGVGLNFPFWNISLFEIADGIDNGECFSSEVGMARALASPTSAAHSHT